MGQAIIGGGGGAAFSFRRLGLLLRRDASLYYRGALIAMAAVAGLVVLASIGRAIENSGEQFHEGIFLLLLFVGGFVATSLAFKEALQNGQGVAYLVLPGSSLEKFASKLLLTSVGYAIGSLVFYTAVAAATEGIMRLTFGVTHPFFNPFDRTVLLAAAGYVVTQSIFLLGSIWFRKQAFMRTWLWLFLLGIVLAALVAVAGRIILADLDWQGGRLVLTPYMARLSGNAVVNALIESRAVPFLRGFEIAFWALLAPACWVATWLRLRETEA